MKSHNYPSIEVRWADHWFESSETDMEDILKNMKPLYRDSVGYLVAETKSVICVASTVDIDKDTGKEYFTEKNFIMKKAIKWRSDRP